MFVVTFLPFSFCALVFPCFHLLFDVGVNGVEFSGLFSDFTTIYFHWEKFSPYMVHEIWKRYSRLRFFPLLDDPKRTNQSH